ncbi:MAG TPA: CHAT domain-containing protein, partial [Thermoanaerobaculia bacterium]|nr:CHAT domain-containing protein [Thermoanaerobaculia bacterium]
EAWKHSERGGPIESSLLYYRARVDLASGHPDKAIKVAATASKQDPTPNWAWQLEYAHGRAEEALGRREAAAAAYDRSIGKLEDLRRDLAFDEMKSWLLDSKRQPFEALFLLQAQAGNATDALATVERALARTFLDAYLHASSSGDQPNQDSWSDASLERMEGLETLLPVMSESPVAAVQPINRVLDALANRHALVYFEAGKKLWLMTLAEGKVSLRALALPAAELRRLADRFLAHPNDSRTASSLGDALLPAGSLPRAGEPLVVVTDGLLGNIPFAALRRGDHFLAEDHSIVFVPSLSALAAIEKGSGATSAPPLILVDPLGNLPAAQSEGLEVAKSLGGVSLTGGQALSRTLAKASGARVLHLATHTGLGPRGAWLQLADRRISASEIVGRRIRPRLAVLASCSSGVRTGRQMWGSLGAAFLAAGSRAVLASLWPVDDQHTREFVHRFYQEGGAVDPATALAQAQRVAIREGVSPNDWAPFVLFGTNRPLNEAHF